MAAARPKTLAAGICPVVAGTVLALRDGVFNGGAAVAAVIGAVAIQIGTNFANDYYDAKHGADTAERLGPDRATQMGWVRPETMKRAMIGAFLAAALAGCYLIFRGGWPIVWIGILSIVFGIWYTGGPFPLGYLGLGDIVVFMFFGPVAVMGTYYVQALTINQGLFWASVPFGLISMAILIVNNVRDRAEDAKTGKRTVAVRFGAVFCRVLYAGALICSALFLLGWGWQYQSGAFISAGAISGIPAAYLIVTFFRTDGRALNKVLAQTGLFLVGYTVLVAMGWMVG